MCTEFTRGNHWTTVYQQGLRLQTTTVHPSWDLPHWSKKGYFLFVYFVCSSVFLAWQDISDKNIAMSNVQDFAACFLSCFYALSLTFRSFIHFEFIFVCGIRRWSSFIFLHASVQFSQHHLLNKLSLAHFLCLLPLSNINWL